MIDVASPRPSMILLIDNYDSFVHNLARYVRELGWEAVVRRNDALTLDEVEALAPSHIIISPGPCTPAEAGISTELVRRFGPSTPILGVCLGHQCIGAAYGGDIVRAGTPVHGKTSRHRSRRLEHLRRPAVAAARRPLSLAGHRQRDRCRRSLRVIATARDDGEIMAVAHREHPVVGVQFHPESAASEYGYAMLDAFLRGDRARAARAAGARGRRARHRRRRSPTRPSSRSCRRRWSRCADAAGDLGQRQAAAGGRRCTSRRAIAA